MNRINVNELSYQEKIMLINARRMIDSVSNSILKNEIELISNVALLNSSVEILIYLFDSVYSLNINPHAKFTEAWKKLDDDLFKSSQSKPIQFTQLDSINKQRNMSLHRGIPPNPDQIIRWVEVCNQFYNFVCDFIFGHQLYLTESSLLSNEFWKEKYEKIELLYQKGDKNSFFRCAFELLQIIDDFIFTRNMNSLVLYKLKFDDIEYKIHKQNHLRFNANDYSISYNNLTKLSLESIFFAELIDVINKESLIITWQGQEIDLANIFKENTTDEEIDQKFHEIYKFLWDVVFLSGIGNTEPFTIFYETLLRTQNEERKLSIYPLLYSRDGLFHYYYGYVKSDLDFLESLKNQEVTFLNIFGASIKYKVEDITYIKNNTDEFMIFVMEVKKEFKPLILQ